MKKYLFLLIGIIFLIPGVVKAQDYTFNVCENNCEWTFNNLNELENHINDLYNSDYNDNNKYENKYTIKIADSNYNFGYDFPMFETNNTEIIFGTGTYTFDGLSMEGRRFVIKGQGIDKTTINTSWLGNEDNYITKLYDITVNVSGEISFDCYPVGYRNVVDKYVYSEESSITFENVVINYTGDRNVYFMIDGYYYMPSISFNNVEINGAHIIFEFENDGDYSLELVDEIFDNLNIINCDFSNSTLAFEVDGKINAVNIKNTKLKNIYAGAGMTVYLDCNTKFNSQMNKGGGNSYYGDDFYFQNEYNAYEYRNGDDNDYNAKIITEVCKDKTLKMNRKISLEEIKNEFGYDIDDTWTFNPEGIIELKNNNLVPIKVGKTNLSKEINDEIKTLRLEVTSIDKSNKNIVNPKTMAPILIILILSLLTLPITIFYKNKSMN